MGEYVYMSFHGGIVTDDFETYEREVARIRNRAKRDRDVTLLVMVGFFVVPVHLIVGLFSLSALLHWVM